MSAKPWIVSSADQTYPLDHFVIPTHYRKDLESVLIPHGLILDRVEKLAADIVADNAEPIIACCILKGGHQFFADLINQIKKRQSRVGKTVPLKLEFIKVKSYHNDSSTGSVEISLSESQMQEFKGKNLLLVEDIIDTGKTMEKLLGKLKEYSPSSVRVVSLLLKDTPRSNGYVPDYVGFEIPDQFVVGYALDYNEYFRDLDHICIINEHGKQAYAQ
ncbi:phosphoribosyltransferase-like protein [Paraphysoderma sedebokerense]|nr:phosphoribosyltransferase-like protein [Paraphysoderma sedebokerense]